MVTRFADGFLRGSSRTRCSSSRGSNVVMTPIQVLADDGVLGSIRRLTPRRDLGFLRPLALGDVIKAIDRSGDLSLFILQRTNIDDDGDP